MKQEIVICLLIAMLAVPGSASSGSVGPGEVDRHHYGGTGSPYDIDPKDIRGSLSQPCPDDIFFVTATLRLVEPSYEEAVLLTTDHAGVPPAVAVTAANPVGKVTVRLGGCDRGFDAFVVGLSSLDETQYTLTWS